MKSLALAVSLRSPSPLTSSFLSRNYTPTHPPFILALLFAILQPAISFASSWHSSSTLPDGETI